VNPWLFLAAVLPISWVLLKKKPAQDDQPQVTTTPVEETDSIEPLTGPALLAKIKELGDESKSDLVRSCGYYSKKSDGSERLNFTGFYEALLEAKDVNLAQEEEVDKDKNGENANEAEITLPTNWRDLERWEIVDKLKEEDISIEILNILFKSYQKEVLLSPSTPKEVFEKLITDIDEETQIIIRRIKDSRARQGQGYVFTFYQEQSYLCDAETLKKLIHKLELFDLDDLRKLEPGAYRNSGNEDLYRDLEKLLFPLLKVSIFFDNFQHPEALFWNPKDYSIDLGRPIALPLIKAELTWFAIGNHEDSNEETTICLGLNAEFLISVNQGIDLGDDSLPEYMQKQIAECYNMFAIFFKDIDLYDQENFGNDWQAKQINS